MFLKLFSTQKLWEEIFKRETEFNPDMEASNTVWQQVFHRTPELKHWFRRRELNLLKGSITSSVSSDFIKGQIFENRYYQALDKISPGIPEVKAEEPPKKLPSRTEFLARVKQVIKE
jgi:hypothetical protein